MSNFIKTIIPIEHYSKIVEFGDKYIVYLDPQEYSDTEYVCYECTTDEIPDVEQLMEELNQHKANVYQMELETAKHQKIVQLDEYDKSSNVNSFSVNGVDIWLDAATRQQLRISLDAYKAMGAETVAKWFNGIKYEYPIETWYQMLNAVEVYASEALNTTEEHKNNILQLDTIEAVNEYDFTQGYPEKLVF